MDDNQNQSEENTGLANNQPEVGLPQTNIEPTQANAEPPQAEPVMPEPVNPPATYQTVPTPAQTNQLDSLAVTKPPKNHKKILIIIISIVAVIILAGVGWLLWSKSKIKPANNASVAPQTEEVAEEKKKDEATLSAEMERFLNPTTGEKWLATPKKLAKQGFYSDPDSGTAEYTDQTTGQTFESAYPEIDYYEIGSRGDKTIILAYSEDRGFGGIGSNELFEKSADGKVALIAQPTHDAPGGAQDPDASYYNTNITIDKTTRYDSLSLPSNITLSDGTKLDRPEWFSFGILIGAGSSSPGEARKKIQELGGNTIYRTETSFDDTKLTNIIYTIETPAHTTYSLPYQPLPQNSNDLTWLGAQKTKDNDEYISPIARGCGAGSGTTRSDALKDSDLKLYKTSPDGQKVYVIKDDNNSLWVKAYEEFKDFYQDDKNKSKISKAEFVAGNAVLVYQDIHGEYLVYIRSEFAAQGGCAKPVVYLYPTKTSQVNVKIGADVKVSDPFYNPITGWNALARPDGQLTVNGQPFDSLFWEGPGIGQYPGIVSGTIVKRSDTIPTIRQQLAQQGFNQKETNDFVEYWQDKLPNKPYIRLTWLTTEQMNQLAPLKISPKPDTIIRTFLDFAGYDQPISLPKQTFTTPERRGFTVTEWGGLSPYKLY